MVALGCCDTPFSSKPVIATREVANASAIRQFEVRGAAVRSGKRSSSFTAALMAVSDLRFISVAE